MKVSIEFLVLAAATHIAIITTKSTSEGAAFRPLLPSVEPTEYKAIVTNTVISVCKKARNFLQFVLCYEFVFVHMSLDSIKYDPNGILFC